MKFNNLLTSSKFAMLVLAIFSAFSISSCKKDDDPLASASFEYELHDGQAVPSAPYKGAHNTDFGVTMMLQEMDNGNTMINLTLKNTVNGGSYHIHAHDGADAGTTPNGTPYDESPNNDVFVQMATGNGGDVTISQEAKMSVADLTTSYEGFFVIHDPLQAISTTDITTYLVVGSFARAQASTADLSSKTFPYAFNTGQVAAAFAYSGSHATNLSASIQVDELMDGRSRVTVRVENAMDGEVYNVHAHDMADAGSTPNGTPYNESPNGEVFAMGMTGANGSASGTNISGLSFANISASYDGFFVIHDPLQPLTTTDPTTYVVLGIFAR